MCAFRASKEMPLVPRWECRTLFSLVAYRMCGSNAYKFCQKIIGDGGKPWPRDEAHRLARIRLDIPNSVDTEWKINVLKSTASPPIRLRSQLHRLASETRDTARQVFAHRGHITPVSGLRPNAVTDTWQVRRSAKGTSYRITRDHDLVASILNRAGSLKADILALLRLIEETVNCIESVSSNRLSNLMCCFYERT